MKEIDRRSFIHKAALTSLSIGLMNKPAILFGNSISRIEKRIGIIGLDTSHSVAFTKALNTNPADASLRGYKVTAAYPYGSKEIESSAKRIPGYIDEVKQLGVEIVDSIQKLLKKVDYILLETNDGRLHLEQARLVIEANKPLFIDKPMTASVKDAKQIFALAREKKVPVFSASSLRYADHIKEIVEDKLVGNITGADTYSPATLENTHPDLFWYGIHGVETLYAIMGTGCKSVTRVFTPNTDVVVGVWEDGRVGTFRGIRTGKKDFGGTAFGTTGIQPIGPYNGYKPLLKKIVEFFDTKVPPVKEADTLEILAFMEAADLSKDRGGASILLEEVLK